MVFVEMTNKDKIFALAGKACIQLHDFFVIIMLGVEPCHTVILLSVCHSV